MSHPYLIEIGTEEIPARFIPQLLKSWKDTFIATAKTNRLPHGDILTYGTYRRLTLLIQNIPEHTPDSEQTVTGPPLKIAYTEEKKLSPAGLGFIKRYGLTPDTIFEQDGYLAGVQTQLGESVETLIPHCIKQSLATLPLPISMFWGAHIGPFIRPIKWILSLYKTQHLPLSFMEISSNNLTYGHRMLTQNLSPQHLISGVPIPISHPNTYLETLETQGYIHADPNIRKTLILESLNQLGCHNPNLELVEEVSWLTEWPTALVGSFESKYLEIPHDVLRETMSKNQRYFGLFNGESLTEKFIIIAENITPQNKAQIILGNEQVLKARLEDAFFFWNEDLKTSLKEKREKLKTITFQKNMGSLWDKTERVKTLATQLFGEDPQLSLAAELSKADLASHMVYEFGSLQGIMGAHYAQKEGFSQAIATAIGEQYTLAKTEIGWKLGIADRLDTIAVCFANALKPTGSQDPWGVRQAVYSILDHLLHPKASLTPISLKNWIATAIENTPHSAQKESAKSAMTDFISQRASTHLATHFPTAAAALNKILLTDFNRALTHAKAIENTKDENLTPIIKVAKRIQNILEKHKTVPTNFKEIGPESIEKIAFTELKKLESHEKNPTQFIQALAHFSSTMETYFEDVLVTDKTHQEKRLSFLSEAHALISNFAAFDQIGG